MWLGITTVGAVVTVSAAALWAGAPAKLLPDGSPYLGWAAFLLAAVAFPALFDLVGGYVLPRRYAQTPAGFGAFVRSWMRGVAVQTAVLFCTGAVVLLAARHGGPISTLAVVAAAMAALLAFQPSMARLVARFEAAAPPQASGAAVWRSLDSGFTGGVPPFAAPVIPAAWTRALPAAASDLLIRRRAAIADSGASLSGALAALLFNLACFAAVMALLRPDLTTAEGLATQALGFNLASFAGLLLLPRFSRRAVLAADRALLAQGTHPDAVSAALRALDAVDEQETARSAALESVFHPIPCVRRRIGGLRDGPKARSGFWHVARFALYSSWGCLGLLGRAVHCNCGRPALWVFLPAD